MPDSGGYVSALGIEGTTLVKIGRAGHATAAQRRGMTWDFFNTAAGAASLMGLIIAVVLGVVSWRSTRATNQLIAEGDAHTQRLIREVHADTLASQERLEARAQEGRDRMEARLLETLNAMDARAETRHREPRD
jgi:hypothetical protein